MKIEKLACMAGKQKQFLYQVVLNDEISDGLHLKSLIIHQSSNLKGGVHLSNILNQ